MNETSIEPRASAVLDFDVLVEGEQAALLRLARRLVWDAEEARDLVQAALADAYEKRHTLRDPQAGPAWLRRILVSRAMGLLRRRRVWSVLRDVLELGPAPQPSPEESFEGAERWRAFGRTLRSLPTLQATAFTLRYLVASLGLLLEEVDGYTRGNPSVRDETYAPFGALALWVRPPDNIALDDRPFRSALAPLHPTSPTQEPSR